MANTEIDSLSLEIAITGLNDKDIKNLESLANSIAKLQRNLKNLELKKLQQIDIPQNIKGVTGVEMPLMKQFDSSFTEQADQVNNTFSEVEETFEKIGESTGNIKKDIAEINTNVPKITPNLKKTNSDLDKTDKKIKKPKKQLNEIEKQLRRIKTIGLVKLIRGAMQSFIRGMGEGYKNLAVFDSQFNETLSTLKTAKTQAFNSLALITAPLVSVITPAITTISGSLVNVANTVSQITASLKGATKYTKINSKYMEDYAGSMQKAQAFSFDTFESLDIQNDNMFETAEIDQAVDSSSDIFSIFSDLKDTFEEIKVIVGDVIGLVGGFLKSNVGNLKEIISQSKEFTTGMLGELKKIDLTKIFSVLSNNVFPTIIKLAGSILKLVEGITESVTPIVELIVEDLLPTLLEIISDSINPIADVLVMIEPLITSIIDGIVSVLHPILKQISPIIKNISDIISRIVEGINFLLGSLLGNFPSTIQRIFDYLQPVVAVVNEILNLVNHIFETINALLHGDWSTALDGLKNAARSIGMLVLKLFTGIIDGIINAVISVINLIIANPVVKTIVGWTGNEWEGITWRSNLTEMIPSFANGGIVGEVWQMNEYGNPEMLYNANGNSTAVITQDQLARAFENAIFNTGLLDSISDSKNIYIDGKYVAQSKNFKTELNRTNPNLNIK